MSNADNVLKSLEILQHSFDKISRDNALMDLIKQETPESNFKLALLLQELLINRSINGRYDNDHYKKMREYLIKNSNIRNHLPDFVNNNRTLDQFWQYIKSKYDHYSERRIFISEQFAQLLTYLEEKTYIGADTPESGHSLLRDFGIKEITEDDIIRLWKSKYSFKVFLSHRDTFKKETACLKEYLGNYNLACFVAHEDIVPDEHWLLEIKRALLSCDIVVALITKDFHESVWTNQEIGIALGLGIPVFSIKLGKPPAGFIANKQAINAEYKNNSLDVEQTAKQLLKTLTKNKNNLELKNKMDEAYKNKCINDLKEASSFKQTHKIIQILSNFDTFTEKQKELLFRIKSDNSEVANISDDTDIKTFFDKLVKI